MTEKTQAAAAGKVLVGVDASDNAVRAAEWAAGEAVARNAPLILVHAISARGASAFEATRHALAREDAITLLDQVAAYVRAQYRASTWRPRYPTCPRPARSPS
jgi:nucleotide-binding universal stress UspA family protein